MEDMRRKMPPFLHAERSRHGKVVWYVRRRPRNRIRLRAEYDTAEFWAEYRSALEGHAPSSAHQKPAAKTIAWAVERYRRSSQWRAFSAATRRQRETFLRSIVETSGTVPIRDISQAAIRAGRERRADRPHAANNFLKAMRGLFAWALEEELTATNPTLSVKLLSGPNDKLGFHTWTEDEIARFEKHWPLGTRQRLAFDILLYTGLRRGDAVRLGRQHIRDGIITIRMEKTGQDVSVPLLAPVAASILAAPTGDLTFLVTERKLPFAKAGFGNWFREACRLAGCPGSAHGLRKAAATRVAEGGASSRQMMALFGWMTEKMATHYTHAADKKRLSTDAAQMLLPAHETKVRTSAEKE